MRTVPSAGHNAARDLHSLQKRAAFDFVHNTPQCYHSCICVSNMQLNSAVFEVTLSLASIWNYGHISSELHDNTFPRSTISHSISQQVTFGGKNRQETDD